MIETCAFGNQGKELLTKSIQVMQEHSVTWSPTMFINNEKYCEFGRKCTAQGYMDFITYICNLYTGPNKPKACNV